MKIAHLMLSCFYIDHANYQENALPRQNKEDGHEVLIIASTEIFVKNNRLGYTNPGKYISEDGIPVIRLPYKKIVCHSVSKKIRKYVGLFRLLEDFSPDVIFFHGLASYEILTVSRYKKKYPNTRILADCHSDYNNSGTNFLSRYVLHRFFYRFFLKKALKDIDKILYITEETRIYIENEYKIGPNLLCYYPLGGHIEEEACYHKIRNRIRKELGIKETDIVLMHSGKMDVKKKTISILKALAQNSTQSFKLLIAGSFTEDIREEVDRYLEKDQRIRFLGWQNSKNLIQYLFATDIYIQPGGQSATMQNALCGRCAVAVFPHLSHKKLLGEAAFYIESAEDIAELLKRIGSSPDLLDKHKKLCFEIAQQQLDYRKLAQVIYDEN